MVVENCELQSSGVQPWTDASLKEAQYYDSITYNLDTPGYFNQLDLLKSYSFGGRVLDIGCGPVLHHVALGLREATQIVGLDFEPANLEVVRRGLSLGKLSEKQERIVDYIHGTGWDSADAHRWLTEVLDLRLGDARSFHPEFENAFDSILQLGCFGCFSTIEEFFTATAHLGKYARPGGRVLSVNWTRFQAPTENLDPRFGGNAVAALLTRDLYRAAFEQAGFTFDELVEDYNLRPISKERGHRSVLWAIARKPA